MLKIMLVTSCAYIAVASSVVQWYSDTTPRGQIIEVRTVDVSPTEYRFEPADITVRLGDTVRFIQSSPMPHNVEFRDVPEGTDLGDVRMGPYMTRAGETYDVAIDGRFVPGTHAYVCTPHETMGMKGTITVGEET